MNTFLHIASVEVLGWALLHFIWQGAALAAGLWLSSALTPESSARVRYATGCFVMLLMPVVFVATTVRGGLRIPAPTSGSAAMIAAPSTVVEEPDEDVLPNIAAPARHSVSSQSASNMLPGAVVCAWLGGVFALSLFAAIGWIRIQRVRRRGIQLASPLHCEVMRNLMRRLEISAPVRLYMSTMAEVPMVIGWVRPYILFPISALTGLTELQLRAIVAHELAHIRRHDYLVNLLQNAVETLLFYHPAVWWVSAQIRQEREHCCDDVAIEVCGDVMAYACALVQLEELRGASSQPALAATGGDLIARIHRLLEHASKKSSNRMSASVGAIITATFVIAAVIGAVQAPAIRAQSSSARTAQPTSKPAAALPMAQVEARTVRSLAPRNESRPEFEAASIRPADPMSRVSSGVGRSGGSGIVNNCGIQRLKMDGSLVSYQCVTVKALIQYAYGIGDLPGEIAGPSWMMDVSPGQRFDIEAKIPEGGPKDCAPEMFQTLLVKRFGLVFHRDQQNAPAFALVIDKSGLKLMAADTSAEADFVANANASPVCPQENFRCAPHILNADGVQTVKMPLSPSLTRISNSRIGTALQTSEPGSGKIHLDAPSTTMAGLADLMPPFGNGERTIDRTGLEGRFKVLLDISLFADRIDAATGAFPQTDGLAPATTAVSPLFNAYQKALQKAGLRLEPTHSPVGTIVIDHLEKTPTEN